MNQKYELDKYYHSIASLFMLIWYCLLMLLITFEKISNYWIWFVIIVFNPVNNIIGKKIKNYYIQNKIPIPKIVKFGKTANVVFFIVALSISVFCLRHIILYK